jgi:hypothetical protein
MHDETQVMNDEDNANDEMTNGSRTRLFKLQQNIHDVLRIQHPDCVEPRRGLSHLRILATGRLGRLSLRTVAAVYDR